MSLTLPGALCKQRLRRRVGDVSYHIVAKDKTWGFGSKTDPRYKTLMKAKTKVQDVFQRVLGRRIERPIL